tara:strand:+ start:1299 stop:2330 length:1032 start_codon:yes stop_codon:yes gene_type:complete
MRLVTFALLSLIHVHALAAITVDNIDALARAITRPNSHIIVEPGVYKLNYRLQIKADNVTIAGASGSPEDVVFRGNGMRPASENGGGEILIDVHADDFTLTGVTLEQSANHLIQVRAELGADNFTLTNSILRDSYEQLLKVSASPNSDSPYSHNGKISNSRFSYSATVGPNYYIGGIDAHRAKNWVVENNHFENIASPSEHIAEHAIHFWRNSHNTIVRDNTIINSDRGIGFGLGNVDNEHIGGAIENNVILHNNPAHPYKDAGIVLESAKGTKVLSNTVLLQSGYPNAIEYRFGFTHSVEIRNNVVLGAIKRRNGASGTVAENAQLTLSDEKRSMWSTLLGK